MINLINDLPDTTKISEGKLNLHRLPLNINELLSERVEEIRRTTKHYFELQFEALPTAQADRERIGQVVTNLLSNAIKYSPRESRIIIRTEQTEAAIRDSIQDEGHDISEEHLQKIFKRVCRANSGNTGTSQGIGLDLYIAEQIIRRHSGCWMCKSKNREGICFLLYTPFIKYETAGWLLVVPDRSTGGLCIPHFYIVGNIFHMFMSQAMIERR